MNDTTTKTMDDFNAMSNDERRKIVKHAIERFALRKTLNDAHVKRVRDTYRNNITKNDLIANIIEIMNVKVKSRSNVNVNNALAMLYGEDVNNVDDVVNE